MERKSGRPQRRFQESQWIGDEWVKRQAASSSSKGPLKAQMIQPKRCLKVCAKQNLDDVKCTEGGRCVYKEGHERNCLCNNHHVERRREHPDKEQTKKDIKPEPVQKEDV